MSQYYVYEHWRPDRNECFYVGKGKGRRALKMLERNRFHAAVQGKLSRLGLCVEVRIIKTGLTESEAFEFEIERIALWRADGADLANISSGGDGSSGIEAWNRRAVTCLSDGRIFKSAVHAAKHYGVSGSTISEACRGVAATASRKYFVYGAKSMPREERAALIAMMKRVRVQSRRIVQEPQAYGSIKNGLDARGRSAAGPQKISRPVMCDDDGRVFSSASEAARNYSVCKSAIIELCLGKRGRKTVGGLVFKYVEQS